MGYHTHQTIRTNAEFRNLGGDLLDPTDVRLILTNPDRDEEEFLFPVPHSRIVRESTGKFHFDFELTARGDWKYYWQGRSPDFEAEAEAKFYVTDSF